MNKPIQYVLCGLPFAGKTTLAKSLEEKLGYARVNIDEIKFEHGFEGISDDDVTNEEWKKIFEDLESRVIKFLKEGKSVLSETAWTTKEWRDKARKVAEKECFETKIIFVNTPLNIARERFLKNKFTKERFDIPDSIFEEAVEEFEIPTTEDENVIIYKNSDPLEEWIISNFNLG